MTKFTKLTVSAIVALLVICLSSTIFAQETTPAGDVSALPLPSGILPTGKTSSPIPSASAPTGGVPSGATPSPSGSAAAEISSIFGQHTSPSAPPAAYATPSSPTSPNTSKAPPVVPNSASKIENGLISGVIIAGIINLFI